MARIYTLVNQKGGVGKTTTAINLAAYLGHHGMRVLLVDLDPQSNATSSVGLDKRLVKHGTYEALIGSEPLHPNIWHSSTFKFSLLPSSPALAGAEIELIDVSHREFRLREMLQPVLERFDYILIDCPPSLGLLTVNGLVAAQNGILIPVQCEYLALEGLGQLTQTINRLKSSIYPQLKVRGVILTMFDGRINLAKGVVSEVRRVFPNLVFQSVIPRSTRLAEAPSYGQPISVYAPESAAAQMYAALAEEILTQDGVRFTEKKE